MSIILNAKKLMESVLDAHPSDPYHLRSHLTEMDKWADKLLVQYPQADGEIVHLTVWLHDIGHYPIQEEDHAITSERVAREFFIREQYPQERMDKVLHAIRAHRCKDIMPQTIEAQIIACIDSASHFTGLIYMDMLSRGCNAESVLAKINRDYRDIGILPEMQRELQELADAIIAVVNAYDRISHKTPVQ